MSQELRDRWNVCTETPTLVPSQTTTSTCRRPPRDGLPGTAGLACPQLPCTRGFLSAFWCLRLRVHNRLKTTRPPESSHIKHPEQTGKTTQRRYTSCGRRCTCHPQRLEKLHPRNSSCRRSDTQQRQPLAIKTPPSRILNSKEELKEKN